MNEAACNVVLNLINLAVRMMPIFVCLEPKRKNRENIAAVSAYLWVIMVSLQSLFHIREPIFPIVQGIFSCLFFLLLLIFFNGELMKKVFLYLSAWLFAILSMSLNEFAASVLGRSIFLSYGQICVIVSLLSACGFYFFVRCWLKDMTSQLFIQLSKRSNLLLTAYPAISLTISLFGTSTIFSRESLTKRGFEDVVFYLAFCTMILVLYVMTLAGTLEAVSRKKTEEELLFARQLIGKQREHYNQMLEHAEELRIIRHDFRHHIHALLNMDKNEQRKYLLDLNKELDTSREQIYCENPAVNQILQEYGIRCQESQIEFEAGLDISAHIPIDDLTLCIVIGNLLENSMEACMKLKENRFIHLQARWKQDHLMMLAENSYNGQIKESEGKLLSSKQDGGLGLLSIRRILNRPGDDFDVYFNETTFTAMVNIMGRSGI
ncbi:hypothetical protein K413DRAFT_1366 [Clostridium sp. ASBs410]|nr:hypothetical protein K413DRAFT_1366 [Clostridium sp. ASBs410]